MIYSKLVIISTHELDRRITVLFQTEELWRRGIRIEYWNVSKITFNEHVNPWDSQVPVIAIGSRAEFEELVARNYDASPLYIVYMNYCHTTYYCYRTLSKYTANIAYCINGVLPQALIPYRRFTLFNLIKSIKNRFALLALKTDWIRPAMFELRTCLKAGHAYKVDAHTIVRGFNSTDFEDSLHVSPNMEEGSYLVFLDQYLPFHKDNTLAGEKGLNAQLYYDQLNKMFDIIESTYKSRVIIAAHPAAKSYLDRNPFNGRKLITGKTKELVAGSMAVIAHCSTAIFFSVIYKKPLLIVSSDDIANNLKRIHSFSEAFANELHLDILFMDTIDKYVHIKNIDDFSYNSFKYNYITTPETENCSNADSLMEILGV